MFTTYILFSESLNQYYVGSTQNIRERLSRHNRGNVYWTRRGCPWRIISQKNFSTRMEAASLEKRIKKTGIKKFLDTSTLAQMADGPERATSAPGLGSSLSPKG